MKGQDGRLLALAQRFAALSPEGRRDLHARLTAQGLGPEALPIPPRADGTAPVQASYAQQRLWFLWQLDPASPAYNLAGALRLTGALDRAALERSFETLAALHEPLRTVFRAADSKIWQHIQILGHRGDRHQRHRPRRLDVLPDLAVRGPEDRAQRLVQRHERFEAAFQRCPVERPG